MDKRFHGGSGLPITNRLNPEKKAIVAMFRHLAQGFVSNTLARIIKLSELYGERNIS